MVVLGVSMILVSSGQCKELEELRVGRVGTLAKTLDPNIVSSWDITMPIKGAVFEGLLRYNPDTAEVEPCLAERWEISKDGKELTFYLRKGVYFHKEFGELTAEDVKATIGRHFEAEKWEILDAARWIPPLNRIEVVDKYTVKFHLEYPDYTLISSTAPMFYGWVTSKKALDKYGPEGIRTNAVGTGPYELEEWVPMQRILLKRFPNYWGKKAWFEKVRCISFASHKALGLALMVGEVDIGPVRAEDIEVYEADPNIDTLVRPRPGGFCRIGFNVQMPPMDDVRVRKAIRYALDVDEIVRAKWGALVKDPRDLRRLRANSILGPGVLGFWEDAPVYTRDLEKSRKLLAEAGYPDGFTVVMPASFHRGGEPETGAVVQSQLKKVGINVEIPVLGIEAFRSEHFPGLGKYAMFVAAWEMVPFPEQILPWWTCDQVGKWNVPKWCNPKYDELLEAAAREPDPTKRTKYYIDMQKLTDQDVVFVPTDRGVEAKAWGSDLDVKFMVPFGWELFRETKRK